jgi:hypothetical protein
MRRETFLVPAENRTPISRSLLSPQLGPTQWVPASVSSAVKQPGVTLTTHLIPVPRLRMCGFFRGLFWEAVSIWTI